MTASSRSSAAPRPTRALLIGPVFSPGDVGGLQLALNEVVEQLTARGWQIDTAIFAAPSTHGPDRSNSNSLHTTIFTSAGLSTFQRWPVLMRLWATLPLSLRRFLSTVAMPRQYWENISHNLHSLESMLANPECYDVVLVCADGNPPGCNALACIRHTRVVIISLPGLANELASHWWRWARLFAGWHLGSQGHSFLFRRILPQQIGLAVFASRQWQQDAIQAGLSEKSTDVIYFGIPLPEPLPRPAESLGRLLWVGRLSPEKGLHLLLQALPTIRRAAANVTLTVIAGQGNIEYRRGIMELACQLGLEDVVEFRPPVDRAALQTAYAEHDVLFFHSVFSEPVALVLMEAFAAGLPVVASQVGPRAKLVQHEVTCLCYQPDDTASVAAAVIRLLTDAPLRQRLARNAQQLVRREFSLDEMGAAYDAALREFVK